MEYLMYTIRRRDPVVAKGIVSPMKKAQDYNGFHGDVPVIQ